MSMRFCVDLTDDRGALAAALAAAPVAASADPIGGKARSLLRLAEAGLRVPAAFVITGQLFRRLRQAGPPVPRALRGAGGLVSHDPPPAPLPPPTCTTQHSHPL